MTFHFSLVLEITVAQGNYYAKFFWTVLAIHLALLVAVAMDKAIEPWTKPKKYQKALWQ